MSLAFILLLMLENIGVFLKKINVVGTFGGTIFKLFIMLAA